MVFSVTRERVDDAFDPDTLLTGPTKCKCPHCKKDVLTVLEYVSTWKSVVVLLAAVLCLGWLAICCVPLVWGLTQDICHFCPKCLNLIGKKSRFSLVPGSANREIVTVRIGNCAMVLSQRYLWISLMGLATVGCIYGVRFYLENVGLPDIPPGTSSDISWEQFVSHCGTRSFLGNPIHAMSYFEDNAYRRLITWEGRLQAVNEGFWRKNILNVIMDPHQHVNPESPDLTLFYDAKMDPQVAKLDVGDRLVFDATLFELGKRGHAHLAFMWSFNRTAGNNDLPPLVPERPKLMMFRIGHLDWDSLGESPNDRPAAGGLPEIAPPDLLDLNVHLDRNEDSARLPEDSSVRVKLVDAVQEGKRGMEAGVGGQAWDGAGDDREAAGMLPMGDDGIGEDQPNPGQTVR